jgi:hypothetical protein
MGGRPAGAIDRAEHDYAHWEKEVDAILTLLRDNKRRLMTVDELRRGIESLPPDDYDRMSYYERWIRSVVTILGEKGVLDRDEIEGRMAKLRDRFAEAEGGA